MKTQFLTIQTKSDPITLYQRIKEFETRDFFNLAAPKTIKRSLIYYYQHRILDFEWNKKLDRLFAMVREIQIYRVTIQFNPESDTLYFKCNCPAWYPFENCQHVVGTMATLLSILSPGVFQLPKLPDPIFFHLKKQLEGHDLPEMVRPLDRGSNENALRLEKISTLVQSGLILHLVKETKGFDLFMSEGQTILDPQSSKIPKKLKAFNHLEENEREKIVVRYLSTVSDPAVLMVHLDNRHEIVKWDPNFIITSKVAITVGEKVKFQKLGFIKNKCFDQLFQIGPTVIADLEKKKLGKLTENNSKSIFFEGPHFIGDPPVVEMSHQAFNHTYFSIPKNEWSEYSKHFTVINKDHQPADILPANIERRTVIQADRSGNAVISFEFGVEDVFVPFKLDSAIQVLDQFLSPFPKKKLHFFLVNALSDLILGWDSKAFQEFSSFLSSFFSKKRQGEDYIDLVNGKLSYEKEILLLLHQNKMIRFTDHYRFSFLPFCIISKLFGQRLDELLRLKKISFPLTALQKNLRKFISLLIEHRFIVIYNNKPIKIAPLQFNIQTEWQSDFDWFSLHPDIRLNGTPLDKEKWNGLLFNHPLIEEKNSFILIDSKSVEQLSAISILLDKQKKIIEKLKNKKQPFPIPRLQILEWMRFTKEGIQVNVPQKIQKILNGLTDFKSVQKQPIPKKFVGSLRGYQKSGVDWLSFLYVSRLGACLADDMGLGKTVQTITFISAICEKIVPSQSEKLRPHLIIVPSSLCFNWKYEFNKFNPSLNILEYFGKDREFNLKSTDVVLTTYDVIRRDIALFQDHHFDVIIFDEAQKVKNIHSDRTGSVRLLKGNFKICLTGTPIENHLGEYFSIMDLAVPGLFGDYEEFKNDIKGPFQAETLIKAKPFVLRRLKSQVLKDLPKKEEIDVVLPMTDLQKAMYTRVVEEIRKTVQTAYQIKTKAQAGIIALTALLRLRQICVSPQLIDAHSKEKSPKLTYILDKVTELIDENHSALIFSQFIGALDLVEELLKFKKITFFRLDGSTPVKKRKEIVNAFQEGLSPGIFLVSLKAGGIGLNLTKASYVFHLDPWWNPAVENQASDRAHRIGQTQTVTVFRILMANSIEEKMMVLKKKKLELYKAVMENIQIGKVDIRKEDFDYLLS